MKLVFTTDMDFISNRLRVRCEVKIGCYLYAQIADEERLYYWSEKLHIRKLIYNSRKKLENYLTEAFFISSH